MSAYWLCYRHATQKQTRQYSSKTCDTTEVIMSFPHGVRFKKNIMA